MQCRVFEKTWQVSEWFQIAVQQDSLLVLDSYVTTGQWLTGKGKPELLTNSSLFNRKQLLVAARNPNCSLFIILSFLLIVISYSICLKRSATPLKKNKIKMLARNTAKLNFILCHNQSVPENCFNCIWCS